MRVIGVGNPWRRDDGAGPAVAQALDGAWTDDPATLLDLWAGAEHAVVVDAAASGAQPGTIHRYDAFVLGHPATSTHALGVADAVELARALGRLPPRVDVYAVEGEDFGYGSGLTPAVADAVAELTRRLRTAVTPDPR
jgi:hydrogenase maturation protease